MNAETLLQTHAEVAIAMAGFASVIAALSRPLPAFTRQRFFSLLALSLIQILGCILPLWLLDRVGSPSTAWRLISIVMLAASLVRMRWLVVLPIRRLGDEARTILHSSVTRFVYLAGYLGLGCFALNAIAIGFEPSLDIYYVGLLTFLVVGFVLFADVATRDA